MMLADLLDVRFFAIFKMPLICLFRVTLLRPLSERPMIVRSLQGGAVDGAYAASDGYCALVYVHRICRNTCAPAGVRPRNPDSAVRALTTTQSTRPCYVCAGGGSSDDAGLGARRRRTGRTGRPGRDVGRHGADTRETTGANLPVASP